jgi:hypothetical protein
MTRSTCAKALAVVSLISATVVGMTAARADQFPSGKALNIIVEQGKRKMEATYKSGGIEGVMNATRACYAGLNPASSMTDRTRCIALDLSGFYFEDAVEPDFKKVDMQMDDYLSNAKFQARMEANMPPLSRSPADKAAKLANFREIVRAYQR